CCPERSREWEEGAAVWDGRLAGAARRAWCAALASAAVHAVAGGLWAVHALSDLLLARERRALLRRADALAGAARRIRAVARLRSHWRNRRWALDTGRSRAGDHRVCVRRAAVVARYCRQDT